MTLDDDVLTEAARRAQLLHVSVGKAVSDLARRGLSVAPPVLEERGRLQGRWGEKAGQRRRRFYRLTNEGRGVLAKQRRTWRTFVNAMDLITGADHV